MRFLSLVLLFIGSYASAGEIHLVIDFEDTFFHAIPKRAVDEFGKQDTVQGARDKTYRVYPSARIALRSLLTQNTNIRLAFIPPRDADDFKNQLSQVKIADGRTFADASTFTTVEGLTALDANPAVDWIVYVTTRPDFRTELPKVQPVYIGRTFFQFASLEKGLAERATVEAKDPKSEYLKNFPATAAEFFGERNRLLAIALELKKAIATGKARNPVEGLREIAPIASLDAEGLALRRIQGLPMIDVRWRVEAGKITGCERFDFEHAKSVSPAPPVASCLKDGAFTLRFETAADALVCRAFDTGTGLALPIPHALGDCATPANSFYAFIDLEKSACMQFHNDKLARIGPAPVAKCSDQLVLKTNAGIAFRFTAFAGMARQSADDIYVSTIAPDANHLDRLFRPFDVDENVGYPLERCRGGHESSFSVNIHKPECLPDTLFSWGPPEKVSALTEWMGKGKWVDSFRALFTIRSPFVTHGYGPIPVRIKLRPGVKWAVNNFGCDASAAAQRTTVFVRKASYFDIVICSPNVIESWSVAQKPHYDEIIKDMKWIQDAKCTSTTCDVYESSQFCGSGDRCFNTNIDGKDFSKARFDQSRKLFLEMIEKGKSLLYCNPDVPKERCTLEAHFSTDHPIYFNEK